jgi:hypothetical protein
MTTNLQRLEPVPSDWLPLKTGRSIGMKCLRQSEGDNAIEINPFRITVAFLVVTPSDNQRHGSKLIDSIFEVLEFTQPAVWKVALAVEDNGIGFLKTLKNCTIIVEANDVGFPYCEPDNIHRQLQKLGLSSSSDSLVINLAVNSYDGGKTKSNLLVGFGFKDKEQCCYYPLRKGCVVPGVNLIEPPGGHVVVIGDVLGLYNSR